jgi:hypothetical protein
MKHTPIPRRVRTARPSALPGVVLMVLVFALIAWAQADDQVANERDRATLRQLARASAGLGCDGHAEQEQPSTTGENP